MGYSVVNRPLNHWKYTNSYRLIGYLSCSFIHTFFCDNKSLLKMHPYFDYCSSVWGSIGVCQSERLQKLQNRAARLITFSDLNVRSSILLGDRGWDFLERRRSKQLAINLFKALHNLSPIRLTSIFKTTSSVHSHNLRNSKYNLFVPRPSTEAGKRSFQYRGSVLWNSLPLSAKTQPTLGSFKSSLCH